MAFNQLKMKAMDIHHPKRILRMFDPSMSSPTVLILLRPTELVNYLCPWPKDSSKTISSNLLYLQLREQKVETYHSGPFKTRT